MTNPTGPLFPGLRYDHLRPVKNEFPPPLPSPAAVRPLHRRLPPELINMDIPISQYQEPPSQQQLVKSINDLAALSAAIDAFKRCYDDIQSHIDFVQYAIDSRFAGVGVCGGRGPADASVGGIGASSYVLPPWTDGFVKAPPRESAATAPELSKKTEAPEKTGAQRMCESMCSQGFRKYILTHLSDPAKLMGEIPAALKLAKDPSKLVFECIGRFYVQGRKAFTEGSPYSRMREAAILVMKCFLLMADCDDAKTVIESSTKEEAEKAAVTWKMRLMKEGGFAKADAMDASGLLLLIACFGIPLDFTSMNLLTLVRQSNAFEIAGALRLSRFLVPKIPGIIDACIERGMLVNAVELVYTLRMEDKFSPPSIITSFLRMSDEAFEKARWTSHSPMKLREASENQLTALLSVLRCLETFNFDPVEALDGWQIKDRITKLEDDIVELDKEIEEKGRSIRIMEETTPAKRQYSRDTKRPRLSLSGMEMHKPSSSYSPTYHDRSFPNRRDEDEDDISALVSSYLGSPSSLPYRSSALRSSCEEDAVRLRSGRGIPAFEPRPGNFPSTLYSLIHGQSHYRRQISPGLGRDSPSVERFVDTPRRYSRDNPPYD